MVLSRADRIMSRRQIEALIKSDGEMIAFKRTGEVEQTDGSFLPGSPMTLDPQLVLVIPFLRRLPIGISISDFGEIPNSSKILVGRYNVDIQVNDTFFWKDQNFSVAELDMKREYHTVARLNYSGGNDHHV